MAKNIERPATGTNVSSARAQLAAGGPSSPSLTDAHPESPTSPTGERGPRGHVDGTQPALPLESPQSASEKHLPHGGVDAKQTALSPDASRSPNEKPLPLPKVDAKQSAASLESPPSPTGKPLPRAEIDAKQTAVCPESPRSPTGKPVAEGHIGEHGPQVPVIRGAADDGKFSPREEKRPGSPPTFEELRLAELREKALLEASPRDEGKGLSDDNLPLSGDMGSPTGAMKTIEAHEHVQDGDAGPEHMLSNEPLYKTNANEERIGGDQQLRPCDRRPQEEILYGRFEISSGPLRRTEDSTSMVIMFSCFCCLLLFNVFVVVSLIWEFLLQTPPDPLTEPAQRLGGPTVDKEQGLHYPLVCGYRCDSGYVTPLPPDGMCDLVFYQLEKNDTFIGWNKSLCLRGAFLPRSMAPGATRYGLGIYAGNARATLRQLSTSAGMLEFLRLWTMGVNHYALSFVVGKKETLASYDFGILDKLRSLQEMADEATGKQYKRRYLVLGIQPWYGNFDSEKEEIARVIHNISVTHPMNMLVLYTHILDQRPIEPCVVAGPAIYDNSLPLPLPSMVTTLELMQLAKIPDTVTVLFSLKVGVSVFQLAGKTGKSTVNYGDACWKVSDAMHVESCKEFPSIEYVDKDMVKIIKPQSIAFQPLYLYDNQTTMETKINLVFDQVERKNFGWSLHFIDKDEVYGQTCHSPDGEDWPRPLIVSHISKVIRRHRHFDIE